MQSTTATAPQAADPSAKPKTSTRLMSLDALRGFDMFWIIGAEEIVHALHEMNDNPVTQFFANQLSHKDWNGFAFYDLIFPMFVFIAGVSLVFSLTKEIEQHGRAGACKRVIRRGLLLVVIGIFYSGGFRNEWPNIRLLGVLQRIGFAYMFAGLIFCWFKPRAMVAICVGLLVGYWALLNFVPIRDIQLEKANLKRLSEQTGIKDPKALFLSTTNYVTGKFDKGYNLANHIDFQYLPGKNYDTYWDPEGMLSTMTGIASCLLGVFAGLLLRSGDFCDKWKLIYLFSFGLGGVLLGFLWGLEFPVIKKIWSSSFVLVAGGYSAMLLGTFYLIVDVWKYQKWCQPFIWIGMNSITVYLANNIISYRSLANRFVGGDIRNFLDTHITKGAGEMVGALTGVGLGILLVWFLHRKRIFLRL